MPRASKMKRPPRDGDHTFYWPDTGPVQCRVVEGEITEGQTVEALAASIEGVEVGPVVWLWVWGGWTA